MDKIHKQAEDLMKAIMREVVKVTPNDNEDGLAIVTCALIHVVAKLEDRFPPGFREFLAALLSGEDMERFGEDTTH